MPDEATTGVALLQMGGPEAPEDLAPFLRALFSDEDMIRLPAWLRPIQPVLGGLYGTWRAREVREDYEAIGYSDLNATTETLADRVEQRLDGHVVGVEPAMRYTPPRADTALEALADDGAERVLAVTLYPFYSLATTGSSLNDLHAARDRVAPDIQLQAVERWGQAPGFLDLTEQWTRDRLAKLDPARERAILLSAHGIPQVYLDEGDPYQDEVEGAARALADRFPDERVELAYQSDVGPVEWLRPYTPDAIRALAEDGVDELVVVPLGFVSEHIETLYEIDVEYREIAEDAGIDGYHRVPAFDAAPAFADLLAGMVEDALGEAA